MFRSVLPPKHRLVAPLLAVIAVLVAAQARRAHAAFSGENGRIYYVVAAFTTSSSIMSACPNGTHVKPVIQGGAYPAPSPDGTKIAYNKITSLGNDGIWVADADGSNPERITNSTYSDYEPTWSPDGTKLTFHRYISYPSPYFSATQPVVADVATKVVTNLLSDGQLVMNNQATGNAWSPDGSTIYFQCSRDGGVSSGIYIVSSGGGSATRILGTDSQFPFYQAIDLSPDGSRFMVEKQLGDAELHREYWRYDNDGNNGVKIADGIPEAGTSGDELLTYSPDGDKILFDRLSVVSNVYHYTLYTADLDGSNATSFGGIEGTLARWSSNVDDCTDPGASTMKINEIGLGTAQFVELLDPADESFPSASGPYKVVVYDGAGTRLGAHTIDSALLQGRDNTKPLLLSTPGSYTAYGAFGPEILSVDLPDVGQACFTKGSAETKLDCVSWGCITAPVTPSSIRIPAPGAGMSAQRQGIGSTTFQIATPTPNATNVAGTTVAACPQGATTTVPTTTTTSTTLPSCTSPRCTLDSAQHAGACSGVSIVAGVAHKIEQAVATIESADGQSNPKKARAARARAKRLLKAAGRQAAKSAHGKKPKLPPACAAAIQSATAAVASELTP